MLLSERERQDQWLRSLSDRFGSGRAALLPILQEVQARYACVDEHAMQVIADMLGIHPVEVYSVVSFYSFLGTEQKGKFVIRLCRTISCQMKGRDMVARQLENDLGITFGETTEDGMFTLEWTSCLGMCDKGPALMVNEKIYSAVTPAGVHAILDECRNKYTVHALAKEGR